jgi:hypothetical protein
MISAQPAIRVAVNDRQLPVPAVLEGGRVLVPFRAIVEALGGSVSQFRLPLPPPARVIAGRTYAPIRYLAQTLNARIEYDGRSHLIQVFTSSNVAAAPAATPAPYADGVQPAPNTRVGTAYPTISAAVPLAQNAAIASLHLTLDGIDVTRDAHYAGTYVTYIPRTGLSLGTHSVVVAGIDTAGRPFDSEWSFETTLPAAPDAEQGFIGAESLLLNVYGTQFIGGSPISVQLTAPPGGTAFAFVCTSSWRFPLYAAPSSTLYSAQVQTARVDSPIYCPITAMYVAWNGTVTYAPTPVFVNLIPDHTPVPAPAQTASPSPSPGPAQTHVPVPTPVRRQTPPPPVATASPKPKATSSPKPHPSVHPIPRERASPPSNSNT